MGARTPGAPQLPCLLACELDQPRGLSRGAPLAARTPNHTPRVCEQTLQPETRSSMLGDGGGVVGRGEASELLWAVGREGCIPGFPPSLRIGQDFCFLVSAPCKRAFLFCPPRRRPPQAPEGYSYARARTGGPERDPP
jgi:hypothetical protein